MGRPNMINGLEVRTADCPATASDSGLPSSLAAKASSALSTQTEQSVALQSPPCSGSMQTALNVSNSVSSLAEYSTDTMKRITRLAARSSRGSAPCSTIEQHKSGWQSSK